MTKHNLNIATLAFNAAASARSPFSVAPKPTSKAARTRKQAQNRLNRSRRAALYSEFQGNNKWNNCSEFHTVLRALSGGTN